MTMMRPPFPVTRQLHMANFRLFVGSVYGATLHTAHALETTLIGDGHGVQLFERPTADDLGDDDSVLIVCTSSTGQGDIPENILPFYLDLRDRLPQQNGRPFAVIAQGDSSYGDTYCGAGEQFYELFLELACRPLDEILRIDVLETVDPDEPAAAWIRRLATQLS